MNEKNSVDTRSVHLNNLWRWGGSIPKGHRFGWFTFLILILFLLRPTFTCQAQPLYACCFETCLSLPFGDEYSGHAIVPANDGNGSVSLMSGGGTPYLDTCFYVVQVDGTGNLLWSRSLCIDPNETPDTTSGDSVITTKTIYPRDIISDGQLGYYVSALRDSVTQTFDPGLGDYVRTGARTFILYKLNASGELLWSKRPAGNTTLPLEKIILHDDHIYGIAYARNGSNFSSPLDSNFHVMKMDTTGTPLWTKNVHTSVVVGNMDITTNANSLVVAASINNDINAVAFDLDGNVEWAKRFDTGYQDRLVGIVPMGDGYAIGFNRNDVAPHPIMLVIDSAGELLSSKSIRAEPSFFMWKFIPYSVNSALMYQMSSVTINDPYAVARKADIWIIDHNNDAVLHERDYSYVATGYWSFGTRYIVDMTRSPSGLLFLYQQSSFFHPTGTTMSLPFITQADSIGTICTHHPAISSNDSVSVENIHASMMSLSVNDVSLSTQNNIAINEPFTIVVYSECTGGVGVSEPEPVLPQVRVFPVPFSNTLNITSEQDQYYQLTLYDASARSVGSYRFHGSTTVPTTNLEPGPYFYQIWSDNELVQSGKVLKQ